MRKFMLLAVASLAAALGVAGVASAVNPDQSLIVKLTSSKAGTKAKPRSVGKLNVETPNTPGPGEAGTFATKTAIISFDKNLVFSPSKFPSCSKSQVEKDETKCPARSRVGGGSATAVLLGQTVNLIVKAYNGPGGNKIFLLVQNPQFNINKALDGTLGNASGAYGKKLTVKIPDNLQQPVAGAYATLTDFKTSVGGRSKNTPYAALKGCTSGKLKFKGVFNYSDGTSKTATTTANCKK
ncbi:MAG: hypothetical protein ACXVSX_16475 [Solirubrobacteraceae bacterium]